MSPTWFWSWLPESWRPILDRLDEPPAHNLPA